LEKSSGKAKKNPPAQAEGYDICYFDNICTLKTGWREITSHAWCQKHSACGGHGRDVLKAPYAQPLYSCGSETHACSLFSFLMAEMFFSSL
jgi:hypothetical protein